MVTFEVNFLGIFNVGYHQEVAFFHSHSKDFILTFGS